jgi:hypothetical protein
MTSKCVLRIVSTCTLLLLGRHHCHVLLLFKNYHPRIHHLSLKLVYCIFRGERGKGGIMITASFNEGHMIAVGPYFTCYTPRNEVRGVYWIQRVRLSVRPSSGFSVFRTYFGLNTQIMKWNLV